MRHVHLVRHGEADNPEGVIYGRLPGFGLSARGREQASRAAEELRRLAEGAQIISSPLQRARETAEIVASGRAIQIDERLNEAHGPFDGLVRRGKLGELVRRASTPSSWRESEAPAAVLRRMRQAIRATTGDVIIVSHQFPIWMARVGFERPGFLSERAPWLFVRGRCELASITTLTLDGTPGAETVRAVSYWAERARPGRPR